MLRNKRVYYRLLLLQAPYRVTKSSKGGNFRSSFWFKIYFWGWKKIDFLLHNILSYQKKKRFWCLQWIFGGFLATFQAFCATATVLVTLSLLWCFLTLRFSFIAGRGTRQTSVGTAIWRRAHTNVNVNVNGMSVCIGNGVGQMTFENVDFFGPWWDFYLLGMETF